MRYVGSKCKRCRAVGASICGRAKCAIVRKPSPPGQHGAARKKKSEFATQLVEKQKIRFTYDVSEKQFYSAFEQATKTKGVTGTILLQLLELRLDNIAFRSNLAGSRSHARQLVSHGHVLVNGEKCTIASARLKIGDKVEICEKSKKFMKETAKTSFVVPDWLTVDANSGVAQVSMIPSRDHIDQTFKEQLVIEYYSR